MFIVDCFGHNIIINDNIVGYIKDNELIINKKTFATITDDGVIYLDGIERGFVDDDGSIIINGNEVGYINGNNDFVFYK